MRLINWAFLLPFVFIRIAFFPLQINAEPPFPRLGLWWPSTETQTPEELARYDWIALQPYNVEAAYRIKKINPKIILLTSTNACELSYDPDNPQAEENMLLRKIPSEWFLTQVGSRLRKNIDAVTTTIPVEEVKLTTNEGELNLFLPGDTIVVNNESMIVKEVHEKERTLSVMRGFIRPASPHDAGDRVASHISFWPNTWVLNLSTLSPKAKIYEKQDFNTWRIYHAQKTIDLLTDPIWDGVLIDRADADASWLIGNSTARSIDAEQTNHLNENYQSFDMAWNEGLKEYEEHIRKAIGKNKLIVVNWGMPNYSILNGNTFEGFPKDDGSSYQSGWSQTVFGQTYFGSYLEWVKKAQRPNLTLIQTYQDDSYPDAFFQGEYENLCDKPGFQPNFQKMRFGLTTALLGDGYFSYEMNTNGHASLCLMWFDEYDNAGKGRGYLGMPLKPATRVENSLKSPSLIPAGKLDNQEDFEQWVSWAEKGSLIEAVFDNLATSGKTSALLNINKTRGIDWEASFSYDPINIKKGEDYTLTFWAKADRERPLTIFVQQSYEPWDIILNFGKVKIGTTWAQFSFSMPAKISESNASLVFGLGEALGKVWLDEISLQEGSPEVYWREFTGGLVIVNATSQSRIITLPRQYRKIKGSQQPQVNDGSLVKEIRLAARDGIILLNP